MSLLLLLLLTIACLPIQWPEPVFGGGRMASAAMTGSMVAGLLFLARLFTSSAVRQLTRSPSDREAVSRAHSFRRLVFFFLNIGCSAFVLYYCGWGWTVKDAMTIEGDYLPGAELVILAPYLITLIGSWAIFYDAERLLHLTGSNPAMHGQFFTRAGYVSFLFRHHLLMVFTPVLLIVTQLSILRLRPDLLESPWAKLAAFAGLFLFILLLPSLVPLVLGLKPMPEGRIRDRLVKSAKRLGVRYRNLYVWDTRGNIATAMVTGIVPQFRQIVFTDLLLATLSDDEIEAVLGHEVGHVRHGHLLYYAAFLMLSFLMLGTAYRAFETQIGATLLKDDQLLIFTVIATGCYLFLVFGFMSRRCERQADVFGCKAVSCTERICIGHGPDTELVAAGRALCPAGIDTFVRALERVEEVNGMARSSVRAVRVGLIGRMAGLLRFVGVCLATWQHSTISKRVAFLKTLADHSEREFNFQLQVTILRWGMILVLVGGVVGVIMFRGWKELLAGV